MNSHLRNFLLFVPPSIALYLPTAHAATCTKIVSAGQSIQSTVNLALPGDVICVRQGIYPEQINISRSGTATSPITIMAYPGETPIIDGQNNPSRLNSSAHLVDLMGNYIIFDKFEVRNSASTGLALTGTHNTVQSSRIHHSYDTGLYAQGDFNALLYNEVWENVQQNLNNHCDPSGIPCWWGTGIAAARDSSDGITNNTIIRGNVSHDNWGEGIDSFESAGTVVENNISYNNFSVDLYISDSQNVVVRNNLVYNLNSTHLRRDGDAALTIADEVANHPRSSNVLVTNNIVFGDDLCEVCWTIPAGLSAINVRNNTVVDGALLIDPTNGTNITESANCRVTSATFISAVRAKLPGTLTPQTFSGAGCPAGTGADISLFQAAGNLITNPGFEENASRWSRTIPGWNKWSQDCTLVNGVCQVDASGNYIPDTSSAYLETVGFNGTGFKAMAWNNRPFTIYLFQQKIAAAGAPPAIANGTYTFRAKVLGNAQLASVMLVAKGYGGADINKSILADMNGAWRSVEIAGIVVTSNKLETGFWVKGDSMNALRIDDVELIRTGP